MSCAYLTDQDIEKIVKAAIKLHETGVEPTWDEIAAIADGDEDIPVLIENMAAIRVWLWTTLEGGIHFLKLERELDLEDMGDKHDPLMAAVLEIRCKGYELNFTETRGVFKLYVDLNQAQEGSLYRMENGRLCQTLSAGEVLLMQKDLTRE